MQEATFASIQQAIVKGICFIQWTLGRIKMNRIHFELSVLERGETVEYENIIYSDCAFIKLHIDGIDLIKQTEDRKGVIVWDELKKTLLNSGDFLVLTCMCGVADDAGFEYITVQRNQNTVEWKFNDNTNIEWTFDRNQYDQEIMGLSSKIDTLEVDLEPKYVVFPE
ncbi:hypothetical protein [Cesiribacter sp. SM1]|uniref:hypothetical protein n=1 Tax=Cesiribacter sp. SM1 TaxID=2861196 RepID=UPI001CD2FC4B|nr:hypothetical protein [Cesiribacter sp. SM1]